jgi:hypothetical protein
MGKVLLRDPPLENPQSGAVGADRQKEGTPWEQSWSLDLWSGCAREAKERKL